MHRPSAPSAGVASPFAGGVTLDTDANSWLRVRPFAYCLAAAVLVYLARIHETLPALAKLYPAKLITLPLIATAIMCLPREQLKRAARMTPVRCVAVIVALGVLSVPGSVYPRNSFMFLTGPFIRFLLFFLLVAAGFGNRRVFRMSVIALVLGVSFAAGRLLLGWNGGYDEDRFAIGGTYDANASAALFVIAIPFALNIASRSGIWRLIGFGSALVLSAAVVKTGSRGGMLGLVVLTPWLLYLAPRSRRVVYVAAVAVGALLIVGTMSSAQRARFASILAPNEDYNMTFREGRIEIWKRGIGYMVKRPLLGVGIDGFPIAEGTISGKRNEGYGIGFMAAHNSFVQIGAELGVFGITAFLVMLGTAAAGVWRVRKLTLARASELSPGVADLEMGLTNACLGALIGAVSTGFFLSLAYDPIMLFVVGAAVGTVIGNPVIQGVRRAMPGPVQATVGAGWRSARSAQVAQARATGRHAMTRRAR